MAAGGIGRPGATLLAPAVPRSLALEDAPHPRRRGGVSRRRLVVTVLVGAVLGAAGGIGVAHTAGTMRAAALLDLTSAMTTGTSGVPSTDQADRFVQSELLYFNSRTFEQRVRAAAPSPVPFRLSATQVGNTDVVQIAAESARGDVAVRAADASIRVYADHRRALLDDQATGVQQQLTAAQHALAAASAANAPTGALQNRVSVLQGEYADAHAAADDPGAGGALVESAADSGYQSSLSSTTAAAGGAALGILLALLLGVAPRLLTHRVAGPDDVPDLGVAVLRPVLPPAPRGWVRRLGERPSADRLETAARLAASRIAGQLADGRPLVLVGAGRGTGSSFAAVNLATALARRRRTVLVAAGDVADGRVAGWFGIAPERAALAELADVDSPLDVEPALKRTAVDGLWLLPAAPSDRWERVEAALAGEVVPVLLANGWTVVVDCPPPDRSSAATELARLRPVLVVVAAAGRTTEAELAATADSVSAPGGSVSVLLDQRPRWPRRRSAS